MEDEIDSRVIPFRFAEKLIERARLCKDEETLAEIEDEAIDATVWSWDCEDWERIIPVMECIDLMEQAFDEEATA